MSGNQIGDNHDNLSEKSDYEIVMVVDKLDEDEDVDTSTWQVSNFEISDETRCLSIVAGVLALFWFQCSQLWMVLGSWFFSLVQIFGLASWQHWLFWFQLSLFERQKSLRDQFLKESDYQSEKSLALAYWFIFIWAEFFGYFFCTNVR